MRGRDKTKVTYIAAGSTGNKTFYAKWTPIKYSIIFNKNGGTSGTMASMTGVAWNSTKTLTANAFKKKGYSFTGWNTEPDGSETAYANKAKVKNLAGEQGAKVTLYAQWAIAQYKITYKLNSGKLSGEYPKTHTHFDEEATVLPKPTRSGYTFLGWYTSSDFKASKEKYVQGGLTRPGAHR